MGSGFGETVLVINWLWLINVSLIAAGDEIAGREDLVDVYLIPGLGSDQRVFRDFHLDPGRIHFLSGWNPEKTVLW